MANPKIIEKKQEIVNEISGKAKEAASIVVFDYKGLTVAETNQLRRELKKSGSDFKIYKNTLARRAFDALNINIGDFLTGSKAIAFGTDSVAPIKTLNDFAKEHPTLEMNVGVVDGEIVDVAKLKELAAIPSREGLLTMLAGGLMGVVRDLAICLDLYANKLEDK